MGCLGCVYDHVALAKMNKIVENKFPFMNKKPKINGKWTILSRFAERH